jgi:hypothetical protein
VLRGRVLRASLVAAALLAFTALGCGDEDVNGVPAGGPDPVTTGCDPDAPPTRTASCVVSFSPGAQAGFGQDAFPEVVYGEPKGGGARTGSTDVLSLGMAGEIVLGFGGNAIVDGEGADFIVFENPFYIGSPPNEKKVFAELGEVAVSEDGVTWTPFPCKTEGYPYEGCAGWKAVFANPETGISAFDPGVAGGDPFDLADIGVAEARFVRIWDLSNKPAGDGKAGFDLDAVAIVQPKVP